MCGLIHDLKGAFGFFFPSHLFGRRTKIRHMKLPKHEGNRIIIAMVLQVDPNSEVVQMIYFMMF